MVRVAISLLLMALLLAGAFLLLDWIEARAPAPPSAPSREPLTVRVESSSVVPREADWVVRGFGTLLPARRAVLAPEVGGRLVRVLEDWREGGRVERDRELFAVDELPLAHEVSIAEARLAQAELAQEQARAEVERQAAALESAVEQRAALQREEERLAELAGEGHVDQNSLDRAAAARAAAALVERRAGGSAERATEEVALAAERADEARHLLERAVDRHARAAVCAPFEGVLVGRAPAVGSTVVAGVPLVELEDVTRLHLRLEIPVEDAAGIRPGLTASVRVPARPELQLEGVVGALGGAADPTSRSLPVEVDLANPLREGEPHARELASGTFAEAEVQVGTLTDVILIEDDHLLWREGAPKAYVVGRDEQGRPIAEERALVLGRSLEEGRVVRSGLAVGDRLITSPLHLLSPGAAVREDSEGAEPR